MGVLEPPPEPPPASASEPALEPPIEPPPIEAPPEPRGMRAIQWFKRFAKLWGFLLFCIFVVYAFRAVVLPFVFAAMVAYLLAPLVDRLARVHLVGRPLPRGLAVVIIYINVIAVLGLFVG